MSLSVSSFPVAPPKPVPQPKWQVISSLKTSGRYLGTLLSKRSVPFVKGIGHFTKTHVKGSITRQCSKVSRSRSIFKHHASSIRSSSVVIDITPISNDDQWSSPRSSDVNASSSSLNPTIGRDSLSPAISEAALSTPTAAKAVLEISSTGPVKASYQSSLQSLVGDSAHAHKLSQTVVQHPEKEHEVASDSEPHDPQPPHSEITIPLPISPSTVPVPSTEFHRRSFSASPGVKASATETVSRTLPRHKSETAIGLPRPGRTTMTPSDYPSSSEGKDSSRGENPIPQPPVTGSTLTPESTSMKKQRKQQCETTSKRARAHSGPSSKSAGSNVAVESPPLLSAHMVSMRSAGSHSRLAANSHHPSTASAQQPFSLSATALVVPKSSSPGQQMDLLQPPPYYRPQTGDIAGASPRSRSSPSLVVGPGPSGDASDQLPLPTRSSVDRARWLRLVAVPHAESWDGERQRLGRGPRTTPEAAQMASW